MPFVFYHVWNVVSSSASIWITIFFFHILKSLTFMIEVKLNVSAVLCLCAWVAGGTGDCVSVTPVRFTQTKLTVHGIRCEWMKWPMMTLSAPGEVHLLSRQILQRAEQMNTGVITAVQFLQRQMRTNCSGGRWTNTNMSSGSGLA